MKIICDVVADVFRLFYPKTCAACGNELLSTEKAICFSCLNDLPLTDFVQYEDNPVAKKFWGRAAVQHAASIFYFRKESRIQQIFHELKYLDNQMVGVELGKIAANELTKASWIHEIDFILPVPLSDKKLYQRGYNQSEKIAEGISDVLKIPCLPDALIRHKHTQSQASLTLKERIENVKDAFSLKCPEKLKGCHVLLLDDVMTTGSTIESCIQTLQQAESISISVLTMAYAID